MKNYHNSKSATKATGFTAEYKRFTKHLQVYNISQDIFNRR